METVSFNLDEEDEKVFTWVSYLKVCEENGLTQLINESMANENVKEPARMCMTHRIEPIDTTNPILINIIKFAVGGNLPRDMEIQIILEFPPGFKDPATFPEAFAEKTQFITTYMKKEDGGVLVLFELRILDQLVNSKSLNITTTEISDILIRKNRDLNYYQDKLAHVQGIQFYILNK